VLDLVAAEPETRLEDLMRTPVVRVHADDLEVAVVAHPGWASFASLPAVDRDERLVGVIRDDAVRPLQASARSGPGSAPVSLALSLAELFWLGLTGVTEGMARVVGREVETEAARSAGPEPAS
jgi:CBS domain-containing protein